jgi:hypothetical protein
MPFGGGSGAAGGAFNGGTIRNPLVIDLSGDSSDRTALDVIEPSTFGFSVRPFRFRQTDFGYLEMLTTGEVSAQGNNFTTGAGDMETSLLDVGGTGLGDGVVRVKDTSNANLGEISVARSVCVQKTAAPDSADLTANQCSLWFDATAGAAKLMVKAKDAGGTVRTATIALA